MAANYTFLSRILEFIILDRLLIRKELKRLQGGVTGTLADIGCGRQPYRNEFTQIGRYLSIDRRNAEIEHDLTSFPYPVEAGTVDWVLCTQVIDDFAEPAPFVRELHRLLAPGGGLILSVSFVWELHDLPHDYGRPSHEALRLLMEQNGFRIEEIKGLGNSWVTLGQVININLLNIMNRRSWWLKAICPVLLLNTMLFYALGSLLNLERFANLPLAFFLVARKK